MTPHIGWFLDGGGCRAAPVLVAQARALAEFCGEQKIPIENIVIGGISIGGIIAAFLAQAHTWEEMSGYLDVLDEMLAKFNTLGPWAIFNLSKKRIVIDSCRDVSILESGRLYQLIDGVTFGTKPLNARRILQSPIPLHILTTNLGTHTQEFFTTRQPRLMDRPTVLRDVIVASASLPPYFPAVIIDGIPHRDGARINLGSLIKAGCDAIFVLLAEPRPQDITATVNNWGWWPWIPEIFEYISAAGNAMDKSELRLTKKRAEEKAYDIKTLEMAGEISRDLAALHHLPGKKQRVRDELGKLIERLECRVGSRHIAYPIPLYSPELPRTLRVESFAPRKTEPADIRDKTTGRLVAKKGDVTYEGDIQKVRRETYDFAKKFLGQVDLDSPEAVQVF